MSFKVYIPARFASVRLPGKPLLVVGGKSIIQHVYERAVVSGAAEVVVATDDVRIRDQVQAFGGQVEMTSAAHRSGTDRIAEAAQLRGEAASTIIVNLQGDEPLMPAMVIHQVAALIEASADYEMSTVCEPLTTDAEWRDPNIVKVVRDQQGRALYFSRAPIPHVREHSDRPAATHWRLRHVGLYAYRVAYLQRFVALSPSELETLERLEQLRALATGARIAVAIAAAPCGIGIDTSHDLERFTVQLTHLASH